MGRHRSRYRLMPLYFITGNAGKFAEVKAILPQIEQLNIDLDEIQSLDPQAVIEHKLAQAAAQHDGAFIVEDSSVSFNCLNGFPGTLIKWLHESLGPAGLADLVHRYKDHSADVIVTIGYRDPAGSLHFFTSKYSGMIVRPQGESGFGWDSIFMVAGHTKTNAELTTDEKNTISARGEAARMLAEHLRKDKSA